MKRLIINGLALAIIAISGSSFSFASDSRMSVINQCSGGGQTCYCTGRCTAGPSGCTCH